MTRTPEQAEAYIAALEYTLNDMTTKRRKLIHEIRVLHQRLADANRGAWRNAEENYELRRQVEEQAKTINALRLENEYFRERMKEERQ